MIRQFFDVKYKKVNMFKMDVQLFGDNYRVAMLSKLYLYIRGIIIQSLKLIGEF